MHKINEAQRDYGSILTTKQPQSNALLIEDRNSAYNSAYHQAMWHSCVEPDTLPTPFCGSHFLLQ
jgi:hypothetical protein